MPEETQITFAKHHSRFVVGVLDIVHSTETTVSLDGDAIDHFYTIFLREISKVIHTHGAKVIKNVGDGVIFYFPQTAEINEESFQEVVSCSSALLEARTKLNSQLTESQLPEISYRVSMSYGQVSAMLDSQSKIIDLFGATLNTCDKFNKLAQPNTAVVGEALYEKLARYGFKGEKIADFAIGQKMRFGVYQLIA